MAATTLLPLSLTVLAFRILYKVVSYTRLGWRQAIYEATLLGAECAAQCRRA